MPKDIKIGNITISQKSPPVIIAEIGINHNGSLKAALQLADLAIKSGAQIIKHQTHVIDDEMSSEAKKIIPGNAKKSIYRIIKECSLSEKDEYKLMTYVRSKKRVFISSPFSRKAVDRLEKFDVPAYKIGSGECNNYPLVEYIAKKNKPIILSTGMNTISSIRPAIKILKKYKIPHILLHCTNIYPTPPKLVKLDAMLELKKNFKNTFYGLSDHTSNIYCSIGAMAMGAKLIEKHFVKSKKDKGPDVSASMSPHELKSLIEASRTIFEAKILKKKGPDKAESKTINFAFGSVASLKDIKKNEIFTEKNIFTIRPGTGYFKVKDYKKILGKKAKRNIKKNVQLKKLDV
jgi:N-acetylneuraminate synthase